ncbi:MAG: hypothetical protein ACQKBY_13470, partial [Verrucomicrobiales bacterium]
DTPRPFLTTVFGARMASRTHLAAKGFVQSSPFVNYTVMGGKHLGEAGMSNRYYHGTAHPVNSPFDYSFEAVSENDSLLPNENAGNSGGYIVTGFTKSDGLTRCVIAELPLRPLASLAELQHWDLRYENPVPPYAFNLIGNSDASPLLPPDAVVNVKDESFGQNLQHDDSFCANHLLFDDWFFSSIAPRPDDFGSIDLSLQENYEAFVSGDTSLTNEAYRPIAADRAAAVLNGESASLYADYVDPKDSWQTIASRLEVEGMFNVNSTSVKAWRALLGHARGQRVPHLTPGGMDLSGEVDYAVSRSSVAGDVAAGENGMSGEFHGDAEYSGYRIFEAAMLDRLAEEVVAQVRLRGPFLSLSEFVNRQLSSGELALAGALQTALNKLAEDASVNPYAEMIAINSRPSSSQPPSSNEAGYQFPEAAEGYNIYGLPGWTRQADILRPLAPVLSARDDTFVIRAYGDVKDAEGNILAKAVCEAVVRRQREFVDPADAADLTTQATSPVNRAFGRRFSLVSFRWLSDSEI